MNRLLSFCLSLAVNHDTKVVIYYIDHISTQHSISIIKTFLSVKMEVCINIIVFSTINI